MKDETRFFAMSTARQNQATGVIPALKPAGGVVAGTGVLTTEGEMPVEFLMPGDRVVTRAGIRTLAAVSVRVDHDVAMVRFGAGTLGHDRPAARTLVPLHQLILIRDWRAQALYGSPQALVAAGRLADGTVIRTETVTEARIFTLQFDQDVVIYAGGLEMVCLKETVTV